VNNIMQKPCNEEIYVMKYLIKEAEKRINEIAEAKSKKVYTVMIPPYSLVHDNMKKIRQLALKVEKMYEEKL
jgi:hypothetical protein